MRGSRWDLDSKMRAAVGYAVTGTFKGAEEYSEVPARTIRDWLDSEWFQALLAEARQSLQDELDGRWTGLIHKITDQMLERLNKGDPKVLRDGTIAYVPVSFKDLGFIQSMVTDKRTLLRGQVAKIPQEKGSTESKLQKIKDALSGQAIADDSEEQETEVQ